MDTKLCRICGKLSENYVHIFKTEGLKNKIETCLPIIVSPHCLLPDTICSECLENVDNFYSFIKNCLQNIIVLEAQYDIMESCLKTKRKHEKGCLADPLRLDKNTQTEEDASCSKLLAAQFEKLNAALSNAESILKGRDPGPAKEPFALVSYEAESEDESEGEDKKGRVLLMPKMQRSRPKAPGARPEKNYFDDAENDLISEIVQRKNLKRKSEAILPHRTKIFKIDSSSRRKSKQPKKVEYFEPPPDAEPPNLTFDNLEKIYELEKSSLVGFRAAEEPPPPPPEPKAEKEGCALPQLCLLCDAQFNGPTMLAAHVYETHGIDMAQVLAQEPVMEKKKKLPNLVKITDLKTKAEAQDAPKDYFEEPPTLQPTYVCPLCPAVLTNRSDLFAHLKVKHSKQASLMCGLCLHMASSYSSLTDHVDSCKLQHNVTSRYICKMCSYHDDNSKAMENHVVVHDFILSFCKKQAKMFDPCDYVEVNANCDVSAKLLSCNECNQGGFATFKEFSTHRRSQHQIFHCDLCNKFYGRNSHLWKHVNRLHKGHPSITCQLCYKTSASKYHLAQHFNKIHSAKPFKQKQLDEDGVESFMSQKFQGFDFQSVRQSFMRQELLEQKKPKGTAASDDANSDTEEMEIDAKDTKEIKSESAVVEIDTDTEVEANDQDEYEPSKPEWKKEATFPKEIDASSDLYTNIITNYTPPQNEGEYKCPKCFKAFHKKTLLKKHRKNCRPRLQKDLLTRCKTCSRIFKDRQSLTKHLINYHSEYACEICGQKVQSKCEIVSHIRFSHPKCHLFCHCGNILRSKADLLEHKKDHRNSFVCQFCADMLPTKIKLKMHILSLHRKILSLSCGICLKLFETQHILRDHVRLVHKDELSPLTSCTVCGKNYGSKWKTYDHLNKSHGRIFKACKACLDVFDTEEELQVHFETIHINVSQGGNSRPSGPNPPPNLSVHANQTYESDMGEDDKHSSSDLSNDVEVFDCMKTDAFEIVKNELNLSEDDDITEVKQEMPDRAAPENRISLLEKRLLGTRRSMESDSVQDKGKQKMTNVALLKKAKAESYETPTKPKETPKEKKPQRPDASTHPKRERDLDLDDAANSQNPLQNSSKRTVYVNSNDPSLCEICLKTWPAKKHLWQHYIRCHKTVAATVCGICLKTNDNYETLQAHLRETHPTLLHGQGFGSNFICRICGRYHNASSKLKLHMAIHENFDWSILDNFNENKPDKGGEAANNGYVEEEEVSYMNSQWPRPAHNHGNEGINYESLIEQVECSSDSDNSDAEPKYHIANSSSDDESDNDSVVSVSEENSLESQMLQNMLNEKYVARKPNLPEKVNSNHYEKKEYSSSDSEDTSDSNQSMSDTEVEIVEDTVHVVKSSSEDEDSSQLSSEECPKVKQEPRTNCDVESSNIFVRKPEELDSAIRSISYEQVTDVHEQIDDVICESLQPHSLNQHEIQSAVDSIL